MCTSEYVPQSITGYGRPLNSWFAVSCQQCNYFNCTRGLTEAERAETARHMKPIKPSQHTEHDIVTEHKRNDDASESESEPDAAKKVAKTGADAPQDLYPCCCYAKKEYYYTQGIHCDALNPIVNPTCEENDLGAQLIGNWDVDDMEYQCFFLTFLNTTSVTTQG
jgi:hypothetical protein